MKKTWKLLHDDPSLLPRYFIHERIIKGIRSYFDAEKFHEIDVPLLSSALIPESYLEIFQTTLLDRQKNAYPAYLTPSPELFLKKLLVAGVGSCYTITKSFRNTDVFSKSHNPEFTMLEWYQTNADCTVLMRHLEKLFVFLYKKISRHSELVYPELIERVEESLANARTAYKMRDPSTALRMTMDYQGKTIDFAPPWHRISMVEAFTRYAEIDLMSVLTDEPLRHLAQKRGYHVSAENTWEELFNQIFLNEVESKLPLDKPVFVFDYPIQVAALAKPKPDDPRFAERFELYCGGLEIANCCVELANVSEQEKRFAENRAERSRLNKIDYPADTDFLDALKTGLPPSAGGAIGIDRLTMLFANTSEIRDTLFFPADEMWNESDKR